MFTSGENQFCCSTTARSARWPRSFRFATAFIFTSSLLRVDGDLFRLRFLGLRQRYRQDAILIRRPHFGRIDRRRQRNAPLETARETFHAMRFSLVVLLLELAFARHGKNTLVQRDIDL